MSQFDSSKDYYDILGAEEGASPRDIERLYKRLAARRHPDRGGSEDEMKSLNEARRSQGRGSKTRVRLATAQTTRSGLYAGLRSAGSRRWVVRPVSKRVSVSDRGPVLIVSGALPVDLVPLAVGYSRDVRDRLRDFIGPRRHAFI